MVAHSNKARRDVFQAIADPVRRDIIKLIAKTPMTPKTVADRFAISRQAVSKHIQILTECGLLSLDIQGREYYYTIEPRQLTQVSNWLESFRKNWDVKFNQLDNVLKKSKNK